MHRLLAALVAACVSAERANLCFNAHGKATLQCTRPVADGPLAVYDDTQTPQKARKMHFRKGKLCKEKRCKLCLAPGGTWLACGSAPVFSVSTMGSNADFEKPKAVAFAALLVAIPVFVFMMMKTPAATAKPSGSNGNGSAAPAAPGIAAGAVDFLLRFASAPWFPLIAALGTAVNMFTIVFTAATVIIFLAAVLGAKRRWPLAALLNAAGATLGTFVMLLLVRERGVDYLTETFPTLLNSPAWAKAMGYMETYGVGGMLLVCSLPILLHPVIAFGVLSGMSDTTILAIVMTGRTIKYLVMGWVTANAPGALRFFGVKASLLDYAAKAVQ